MFAKIKKFFSKKKKISGPHYTNSELSFFQEKFSKNQERYIKLALEIGPISSTQVAVLHAVDANMHFNIGSFEQHSVGALKGLNMQQIEKKLKLDHDKVVEVMGYFKI